MTPINSTSKQLENLSLQLQDNKPKTREMATQTEPLMETSLLDAIADELTDSISLERMRTPYIGACGHTFDKESLVARITCASQKTIECALCRNPTWIKSWYYNESLKKISELMEDAKWRVP